MTPDGLAYLETHGGAMLPPLFARPPVDTAEERRICRLAAARHTPASWRHRPPRTRPDLPPAPPPPHPRQLAAARPHHHAELGRRPGRPDRRAARLPSQD